MNGSQQVLGLYDPAKVLVTLGLLPPLIVTGYWGEDPIKVTGSAPRWIHREGCDGESARFRRRSSRAQLQLTLAPTSIANDALTAARMTDQFTGVVSFPMSITDLNSKGRTVAWAERAFIPGPPIEVVFGRRAAARVWVVELIGYEIVLGSIARFGKAGDIIVGALADISS